jgi:hypothetical protein
MAIAAHETTRDHQIRQRYALFCQIIGGHVPDHVIAEIAVVEPPGTLRTALDQNDRQALQVMLQSHLTRAYSLVADIHISLDQARHLMRTRGIGKMLAILDSRDVPELAQLATLSHLEMQEHAERRTEQHPPVRSDDLTQGKPPSTGPRLAPPTTMLTEQGNAHGHNVVDMARPARPPHAPPAGASGTAHNRSRHTGNGARASTAAPHPAPREGAPKASYENPELNPVRVFNKPRAAALFEMTLWDGVPTLRIESAPGPHPDKPDQYHWEKKIIFNLTADELPVLVATMLGLLPECTFSNHGPQNNKSMSMKYQEQNLYLTMNEGSESRNAVRIDVGPAYHATVLACEILMRATKAASWDVCYAAIGRVVAPMHAKKLAAKPSPNRAASR